MDDNDIECYSVESGYSDEEGIAADVRQLPTSEPGFQVFDFDHAISLMRKCLLEVKEVLELPETMCRMLLQSFNWNKERLLEKYFEVPDADKFFAKSVNVPFEQSARYSGKATVSSGDCEICYDSSSLRGFACGHKYCLACWDTYLTTKVRDENCAHLICPGVQCSVIVDDEQALELICTANVKDIYKRSIIDSFIQCNRLLRWCPAPDCGRVLMVQHSGSMFVKCTCGQVFCFLCGLDWHEPVNCEMLKKWIKKCSDDSETSNWIVSNTKECPKCSATIEKSGGCNHMVCRNGSCRFEFCWMCLGKWPHIRGDNPYSCSIWDKEKDQDQSEKIAGRRADLQRYLFYYDRFANHQRSLKFEEKLYSITDDKMMQLLQQANMSWIEVQFLRKAVDILVECRRTLMYTYTFAFYLQTNNQAEIFQDNQRDLEHAVEDLSELLERNLDDEKDFVSLKQRVQDKYFYVQNRRTTLLRHCSEGDECGFWLFKS